MDSARPRMQRLFRWLEVELDVISIAVVGDHREVADYVPEGEEV